MATAKSSAVLTMTGLISGIENLLESFRASSSSSGGVFCVFFTRAWNTMTPWAEAVS